MSHCMVRRCNSGHGKNREKKNLFSAPKDLDLRKKWQIAIRRNDIELKSGFRVCEKHFLPDQIRYQRILLDQNGAVLGVVSTYVLYMFNFIILCPIPGYFLNF